MKKLVATVALLGLFTLGCSVSADGDEEGAEGAVRIEVDGQTVEVKGANNSGGQGEGSIKIDGDKGTIEISGAGKGGDAGVKIDGSGVTVEAEGTSGSAGASAGSDGVTVEAKKGKKRGR